ncbi:hypothetical protein GQ43DRAFT_64854 [Delitschia confertaspora ATCC 74209]|uniref:Uncharacterized protein n=1 Tax=Delitschia confertaspora ATCC 74209 TaxID=1513339 RepID=A0A9P4JPF8_9PLEO|nr:hypothetical protein GQ43DRAFT_64854 [Delitschia confertaspora ATCC 74209]
MPLVSAVLMVWSTFQAMILLYVFTLLLELGLGLLHMLSRTNVDFFDNVPRIEHLCKRFVIVVPADIQALSVFNSQVLAVPRASSVYVLLTISVVSIVRGDASRIKCKCGVVGSEQCSSMGTGRQLQSVNEPMVG